MHKIKPANKIQKVKRTDIFSKKKRSEIMSRVKNKESKIEKKIGKILWAQGFRYRKNVSSLMGKPDFANKKEKTVIFVDSCFWHGCERHKNLPKSNKDFWVKKILRNKERDTEVSKYYRNLKWKIIRIWEHDLNQNNFKKFSKIKL